MHLNECGNEDVLVCGIFLDGNHAVLKRVDSTVSSGISSHNPAQHSFDDASLVEIPLDPTPSYSRPQPLKAPIISTIY